MIHDLTNLICTLGTAVDDLTAAGPPFPIGIDLRMSEIGKKESLDLPGGIGRIKAASLYFT
jgi:hypothetical protein